MDLTAFDHSPGIQLGDDLLELAARSSY